MRLVRGRTTLDAPSAPASTPTVPRPPVAYTAWVVPRSTDAYVDAVHAHNAAARGGRHGQRAARTPAGGVRARVAPRAGASSGRAREQQGRELHLQVALSPDGIRSGDGRSVSEAFANVGKEVHRFSQSGRGWSAVRRAVRAVEVHARRAEDDPMNTHHVAG
jgi:hypothetical protein